MKFTSAFALTTLALTATAQQDALSSISAHWNDFASVVNNAMPWLSNAPRPTVYNSLTQIFHATTIPPTYAETVVVQMASAMPDPLINNMLMRAQITGVTVSNHNFVGGSPTMAPSSASASVPTPTPGPTSSAPTSTPAATPTATPTAIMQ
ncbi:hypothetical protein EC988_000418 [Linderina pennispora]|nr:hypothetical protein EC988_000418 [Linderina pennispora]